jgi:hypothetical protein
MPQSEVKKTKRKTARMTKWQTHGFVFLIACVAFALGYTSKKDALSTQRELASQGSNHFSALAQGEDQRSRTSGSGPVSLFSDKGSVSKRRYLEFAQKISDARDLAVRGDYEDAISFLQSKDSFGPFENYRRYYLAHWTLKLDKPSKKQLALAHRMAAELAAAGNPQPFSFQAEPLLATIEFELGDKAYEEKKTFEASQLYEVAFERLSPKEYPEHHRQFKKLIKLYRKEDRNDLIQAWYFQIHEFYGKKSEVPRVLARLFPASIKRKVKDQKDSRSFYAKTDTAAKKKDKSEERIRLRNQREIRKWRAHVKRRGPRAADAAWRLADYYEEKGDFKEAIYFLTQLLHNRDDKKREMALFMRGWLYVHKGQYEFAETDFRTLLKDYPAGQFDLRASYWLGRVLLNQKETKKKKEGRAKLISIIQNQPLTYYATVASFHLDFDLGKQIGGNLPPLEMRDPSLLPHEIASIERTEAFLEIDRKDLARIEVTFLRKQTDPKRERLTRGFRIYLSMLSSEADYHLATFQMMWKDINKSKPLRTVATMELLYPNPSDILTTVEKHAGDLDPLLVLSLMRQESAFQKKALSSAGAQGLMQLMPNTAKLIDRNAARDLYDPKNNIFLGVSYLKKMLKRFDGNLILALAAYNAGPHRVDDWIKRYDPSAVEIFIESIPFKETRNYVKLILRNYYWYKKLQKGKTVSDLSWVTAVQY